MGPRTRWLWDHWYDRPMPKFPSHLFTNQHKSKMSKELQPIRVALEEMKILANKAAAVDPADYSELVDSGADIIQVVQIGEQLFADGFQWQDLFGAIQAQPIINELIKDISVAIRAVGNALPAQTIQAAIDINKEAQRRGAIGKVSGFIIGVFYTLSAGYKGGDQMLQITLNQKDIIVSLLNGTLVVPDEVPLLLQG